MFPNAKVYFDGSHYIAIPERAAKKRPKKPRQPAEKVAVIITENGVKPATETTEKEKTQFEKDMEYLVETGLSNESEIEQKPSNNSINKQNEPLIHMSRTEIFDRVYEENKHLTKAQLRIKLYSALNPYFKNKSDAEYFLENNLLRKRRNASSRKNRAWRKARLAGFNYFCTFTYDSDKLSEGDFRKKLAKTLRNFSVRKGWRYMGVWERGEKSERLHFHALLYVPNGQMVGNFVEVRDYNTSKRRMQTQLVNSYFGDRFGRTTFERIEPQEIASSLNYILKYIEKTGEKIVYSRGLFMYFHSDILDDDVIMQMSNANHEYRNDKYILSDKFTCLDEGEIIGEVSSETIRKMRHSNK